jgi:hypothetical protein
MGAHILLHLAVNSKSELKVDSLPPLGLDLVTFGTLEHLSDHSAPTPLSLALSLSPNAGDSKWVRGLKCNNISVRMRAIVNGSMALNAITFQSSEFRVQSTPTRHHGNYNLT